MLLFKARHHTDFLLTQENAGRHQLSGRHCRGGGTTHRILPFWSGTSLTPSESRSLQPISINYLVAEWNLPNELRGLSR